MQDRFKQLLEEKNLTAARFAAMIKVNASAMSHILNGRSKPGFDVLDKIAQAFPDVNLNWLISGKGAPYLSQGTSNTIEKKSNISSPQEKASKNTSIASEVKSETIPNIEIQRYASTTPRKIKRIVLLFEDGSFENYDAAILNQQSQR